MALDFFQRIHITRVTHGLYLPDTGCHWRSIGYVDFNQRRNQSGLMKIYYVLVSVGSVDKG